MKLAVKYDNGMYTTKIPNLIVDDELPVDEDVEEIEDDIDYEFAERNAEEYEYFLKLAKRYNKL